MSPVNPGPGLRERRKRATREALTQAALTLAAGHGLEHVTVEAISEAAGVSPRTFFNYFATKEDAVVGDAGEGMARVCHHVRTLPAELSALAALRTALTRELVETPHEQATFTLRMAVLEQSPSLYPRIMASTESAMRELTQAIADRVGVDAGHPFPCLLAVVAGSAFRATLMKWHTAGGTADPAALLTETFELLAAGLPDPKPDPNLAPKP
ncbi:TetR family transcriptional regulator [Kineosporia sp. J2-2]|uniref:TetR family transcriptional regulator n=1 Tax=Kineosporia corallincola TaxID=2835133 RepID=A0ABS5TCH4_9ACTN|nr:TetR/AcrR family transcriptional regulator [Kineosporia corallincola]MBT0768785.1 TetR family transcriptional regulator [Kineosporia corallincola]